MIEIDIEELKKELLESKVVLYINKIKDLGNDKIVLESKLNAVIGIKDNTVFLNCRTSVHISFIRCYWTINDESIFNPLYNESKIINNYKIMKVKNNLLQRNKE